MTDDRPIGVTIIAVVEGLVSIGLIVLGISALAFRQAQITPPPGTNVTATNIGALGILFLILGLIGLALAVGLYKGNKAVYVITVVFEIFGIVSSLLAIKTLWFAFIIDMIILVYLVVPEDVREYFDF